MAMRKPIGAQQDRGPGFLRRASALSALHPEGSEEKQPLDPIPWAAPR